MPARCAYPRGVGRRLLTSVLAAVVAVGPAPVRAQTDPIDALLAARAAAVVARDSPAFVATMTGAPTEFLDARTRWFLGMRSLPLASYRLQRDPDGPASYPARERPGFEETTIIPVLETLEITGYDTGAPQVLDRFLTLARRGTRWSVIDDAELADVGLDPSRDLWDLGAVTTNAADGILVIARNASAARTATFLREIDAARDRVGRSWPFGAPDRIVALIPGATADLRALFAGEADVERFVGFATSTWSRNDGEIVLGGRRLVVNPRGFFGASTGGRADILGHEVLHLATNRATGVMVPAWLEEGLAQVFGERTPRSTSALRRARVELPSDHIFSSGTDAEVARAYRTSLSFVRFLARKHGKPAIARFQRALGAISAVSAGTRDYHLERTARRVFGQGFAANVRAWQTEVRGGRT